MSEIVVIAPIEIASAFGLAGVEVLPARTPAEVLDHVHDLLSRSKNQLVLLPEEACLSLNRGAYGEVMQSDHPCFVPMPMDRHSPQDAQRRLEIRLGRILGCRIRLGEPVHQPREQGPP